MAHLLDSLSGDLGDQDWVRIRQMWGRAHAGIPVAITSPIFGSMAAGLGNPGGGTPIGPPRRGGIAGEREALAAMLAGMDRRVPSVPSSAEPRLSSSTPAWHAEPE